MCVFSTWVEEGYWRYDAEGEWVLDWGNARGGEEGFVGHIEDEVLCGGSEGKNEEKGRNKITYLL